MIDIQHHFECFEYNSRGGFCDCSDEHEGRKVRLTHGPCFQALVFSAGTTIFPSISPQPPTLPRVSAYSGDSKSMNSTLHTNVHSRPDEEQSLSGHIIAKRGITLPEASVPPQSFECQEVSSARGKHQTAVHQDVNDMPHRGAYLRMMVSAPS